MQIDTHTYVCVDKYLNALRLLGKDVPDILRLLPMGFENKESKREGKELLFFIQYPAVFIC